MSKCEPCRRNAHAECFYPQTAQCECKCNSRLPDTGFEPTSDAERLEALLALLMNDGLPLIMPLLSKRFAENMRPRLTLPPDCFKVSGARLQEMLRDAGGNYAQMVEFVSVDADYLVPFHTLNVLINSGPNGAEFYRPGSRQPKA